jgi:L,D-transpeptidase YbiS
MHRGGMIVWLLVVAVSLFTGCDGIDSASDAAGTVVAYPPADVLRARHASLRRQLAQQAPAGPYIIVDTARNRLYVKRRDDTLVAALASTGSGTILDKPNQADGQWVFDTPRGEFSIRSKLANPVWVKPDWAFLEEGAPIPKDRAERIEAGILGEYALGFGNGYFIHGTLYTRLLGKNVTHGCIRLSDGDLRAVHKIAKIGTPLMIF